MAAQDAKQDRNQFPGLIVVQGTAGTADTGTPNDGSGTSVLLRVGGNPQTGAMYVQDLSPSSNTYGSVATVVDGATGTIISIGTTAAGFKLRGFLATGSGQGYYS